MPTYLHPASNSRVEAERWVWIGRYNDNTELKQFDDAGVFHNFGEIDQQRLKSFHMVNSQSGQNVTLLFPAGAKLIHFYRNATLEVGTPNERSVRLYCFGYEHNSIRCHFVITPVDEVIFTDDFDKIGVT